MLHAARWILLSATLSCVAAAEVTLGKTKIVGVDFPQFGQEFFGGIPFASPPVGNLRFKPPVPKFTLDGASFAATNFSASCLQPDLPFSEMSEDCLTLNVFRPAGLSSNAALPVMVYIYGGGFAEGQSSAANGTGIVAQSVARGTPIVYASLNYRVGPLGFPQGEEAVSDGLLNVGLHDQLVALQWVHANIHAFGGDPKKVTVFGQSAGSMSISHHYLNDLSSLARAVIFESGWGSTLPVFNGTALQPTWVAWANATAACASSPTFSANNTLDCLRSANVTELLDALPAVSEHPFPFIPVLDGPNGIIPGHPTERAAKGAGGKLPFISGTVLDEGTSFTPPSLMGEAQADALGVITFSPSPAGPEALLQAVEDTLAQYSEDPADGCPYFTGNDTFGLDPEYKRVAAFETDLVFLSLRRWFGRAAAARGVPVYSYMFTDPQPENPPEVGVTHASELPYVFGAPPAGNPGAPTLSKQMMDYWISFATSLDPNDGKGTARPKWEPFTPSKEVIMQLNHANLTMVADEFHIAQTNFNDGTHFVFSQ